MKTVPPNCAGHHPNGAANCALLALFGAGANKKPFFVRAVTLPPVIGENLPIHALKGVSEAQRSFFHQIFVVIERELLTLASELHMLATSSAVGTALATQESYERGIDEQFHAPCAAGFGLGAQGGGSL
ncbi:MAG TPA: hypothetical protein VMF06_09315 [Candidatus Limnocylindria bacterium]|nr:hypothetical protein [Candidatus Limnocylindria bacterium]